MNAQQHWKGLYKLFIENPLDVMGVNCRNRMYQDRREAALERALEASQREVKRLKEEKINMLIDQAMKSEERQREIEKLSALVSQLKHNLISK